MLSNKIKAMDYQFRVGNREIRKTVLILEMVYTGNDMGDNGWKLHIQVQMGENSISII